MYSSQSLVKSKANDLRVKSTTKTDTDHHNGDLKLCFSPSVILLVTFNVVVFNVDTKKIKDLLL